MAEPTTRDQILDTADALLKRYGARKFAVIDVARELDMSHSNVYRFFRSKKAIYGALAKRWLCNAEVALAEIADGPGSASQKLEAYVLELHRIKRDKVIADREYFATYTTIVEQCQDVVGEHLKGLRDIMRRIVEQGVADGEFDLRGESVDDVVATIEHATLRFRIPALVLRFIEEDTEPMARRLVQLLLRGLAFNGGSSS